MAAGQIPAPGTQWGPCAEPCQHTDCAASRRTAESLCVVCKLPIRYATAFYDVTDRGSGKDFAHAVCFEEQLEAERQQRVKVGTIHQLSEVYDLYNDGTIGRPERGVEPSRDWRVTHFTTFNNFGKQTARIPFALMLENPLCLGAWQYGNGKQRIFIEDFDHGANRLWANPTPYTVLWNALN